MIRELVNSLGGPVAVAKEISAVTGEAVHSNTITAWSRRNQIPWRWRASVKSLVIEKGIPLSDCHMKALTLKPTREAAE